MNVAVYAVEPYTFVSPVMAIVPAADAPMSPRVHVTVPALYCVALSLVGASTASALASAPQTGCTKSLIARELMVALLITIVKVLEVWPASHVALMLNV